jgi:Domain of unknown function (DUF4421)
MVKYILLTLGGTLLFVRLMAQNEVEAYSATLKFDSTYIKNYASLLALKLVAVKKFSRVLIKDHAQDKLHYFPNENLNLGVGFNYKWLGLNLAFNLPFINKDNAIYGNTESIDLQTNIYGRKYGLDAYLQYYKGFYINNPIDVFGTWQSASYPTRPDLRTLRLGTDFYYIFNDRKFSYRAAFVQNERQLKSAGSWLLGAYTSYLLIAADSSILPQILASQMNEIPDIASARFINMGVSGGYVHTFVIKKNFFFTFDLQLGVGLQDRLARTFSNIEYQRGGLQTKSKARFAFGYNTDRYFAGINYLSDNILSRQDDGVQITNSAGLFRLFFGRRLEIHTKKKYQTSIP